MHGKLGSLVLLRTIVGVGTGTARATDDSVKGAARALSKEAKQDFDAVRFEEAGREVPAGLRGGEGAHPGPVGGTGVGPKHGQLVTASELYRQATRLTANDLWVGNAQQQAQADAARGVGRSQHPRVPVLRVQVEGAAADDVTLTIDGALIASALFGIDLPADPGWRRVVGKSGDESSEQTVYLREGDYKEVVVKFSAADCCFYNFSFSQLKHPDAHYKCNGNCCRNCKCAPCYFPESEFTTTKPSPAIATTSMIKIATDAVVPLEPADFYFCNLCQRFCIVPN